MLLSYTNPVGDGAGAPPLIQFRPKVFFYFIFFLLQDNPKNKNQKRILYRMVKMRVVHLQLIIIMLKVYV